MRKIDICTSLFFMFLSIAVCISAFKLSLYGPRGPGPGFMGFCTGVLLFIISSYLFLKSLFNTKVETTVFAPLINMKQNLLILGLLIFYVITLERLGFIVTIFVLNSALFSVSKSLKWHVALITSLVVAVVSHIIFAEFLKIGLPLGIMSFLR